MRNKPFKADLVQGVAPRASRREFLRLAAAAPLVVLSSGSASVWPGQNPPTYSPRFPNSRAFDFSSLNSWITPTKEFYLRSHFGVPSTSGEWALSVNGEVDRERTLHLTELKSLPARELVVTLECAGNLVGWGGVSNARWKGARLRDMLKAAGVKDGAIEVVLSGADGGADREAGGVQIDSFARAIPLSKALDPDTLLAYEMNGEPLPAEHGGPVRALVPGFYAMDSVKWLRTITISRTKFSGFYQTRRYYEARRTPGGTTVNNPLHTMLVKSQIARPIRGAALALGRIQIIGAAWSGAEAIQSVRVSTDGGSHWASATLSSEHARYSWRLWSYDWTPASAGRHEIVVRASDSAGNEQPLYQDRSILTPYENNWTDRRTIDIYS